MKRALYFGSLVCLFGMLFCMSRWYALPKTEGQNVAAAPDDEASARAQFEDFLAPQNQSDNLLHDAAAFLVGAGVCFFVGRRIR